MSNATYSSNLPDLRNIPANASDEERMRALIEILSSYIEHFHGGAVEMLSFDGRTKVKMTGACVNCRSRRSRCWLDRRAPSSRSSRLKSGSRLRTCHAGARGGEASQHSTCLRSGSPYEQNKLQVAPHDHAARPAAVGRSAAWCCAVAAVAQHGGPAAPEITGAAAKNRPRTVTGNVPLGRRASEV